MLNRLHTQVVAIHCLKRTNSVYKTEVSTYPLIFRMSRSLHQAHAPGCHHHQHLCGLHIPLKTALRCLPIGILNGQGLHKPQQHRPFLPSATAGSWNINHSHVDNLGRADTSGSSGDGGRGKGGKPKLLDEDPGDGQQHSPGGILHLAQLLQQVLLALMLPIMLPAPTAAAAAVSSKSKGSQQLDSQSSWEVDAFVDRMWDLSGPILKNAGFSGIVGACSAAALKWVGRTLAATLGAGLILIQVLSHYNVITVNWSVVHKQARQVLDTTGDGRLDQDDFKRFVKQGLVILSEGVPSVSGFLVGFLVGLKVF